MELIRKDETPFLKCDCGGIFSIDSNDSIHQKNLKENKFRKNHSKCIQNNKYPEIRDMPEFNQKRRQSPTQKI